MIVGFCIFDQRAKDVEAYRKHGNDLQSNIEQAAEWWRGTVEGVVSQIRLPWLRADPDCKMICIKCCDIVMTWGHASVPGCCRGFICLWEAVHALALRACLSCKNHIIHFYIYIKNNHHCVGNELWCSESATTSIASHFLTCLMRLNIALKIGYVMGLLSDCQ